MPSINERGSQVLELLNHEKSQFIEVNRNAREHAKTYLGALKAVPEERAHQYQSLHTVAQSSRANLDQDIRTMKSCFDRLSGLASELKALISESGGYDFENDTVDDVDKFVDMMDEPIDHFDVNIMLAELDEPLVHDAQKPHIHQVIDYNAVLDSLLKTCADMIRSNEAKLTEIDQIRSE